MGKIISFACNRLSIYKTGVGEAIISLSDEDKPTGIICPNYENGVCLDKLNHLDSCLKREGFDPTWSGAYNQRYDKIEENLAKEKGIRLDWRGKLKLSDRDKATLKPLVLAEIERLKQEEIKKLEISTKCIVAEGFKVLK
jgi:hypothetical protein